MRVALLGLHHPHSSILLDTLCQLQAVSEVVLWDEEDGASAPPYVSSFPKVASLTHELPTILRDPEVRFALVCLPPSQSAGITEQLLENGKHVMAEKPVGLTATGILQLDVLAKRKGRVASVLYPRRFHACAVAAKDIVGSGALGAPLTVDVRFLTTQVRFRHPQSWLFHKADSGGGIVSWLGCHCLDLVRHISGDEVVEVAAHYATRSGEAIDVEDVAALSFRLGSGAVGTFQAGYTLAYSGEGYLNSKGYDSYLGFNHAAGRIVWPDLSPRLYIERPPHGKEPAGAERQFEDTPSTAYGGAGGIRFFEQFIAATEGRAEPPTTLADAAAVARIVEAAAVSSQTSRFVRL